jgi:hypothetical protein
MTCNGKAVTHLQKKPLGRQIPRSYFQTLSRIGQPTMAGR